MNIPIATYRIQLTPSFGFRSLKGVIPYLHDLGISHVYLSPIFKAKKGSTHGYDIVDPNQLNSELGTQADFEEVIEELKSHGMYLLQDIVPNHMAYDSENKMLMGVLQNGESSRYAHLFDIEWNHQSQGLKGKVLAPFLGKFYAQSLEEREIELTYDEKGLGIRYSGLWFPLRIGSYIQVFGHNMQQLEQTLGPNSSEFLKYEGTLHFLRAAVPRVHFKEEYDQIGHAKEALWQLYSNGKAIKEFVSKNIELFNGKLGNATSFDLLDRLLSDQTFRLSFWKVAAEEINYRRFFSINGLISVRVEEDEVFGQTHRLLFQLVEEGKVGALRIDHLDGLYDPSSYLRRLRAGVGDIYIVAEKILSPEEDLLLSWPVQGTTGYEFLNRVSTIFCDQRNKGEFNDLYRRFTRLQTPFRKLLHESKRLIIANHMAGDIDNLTLLLKKISDRDKYGRDITAYGIRRALVEAMIHFPVYRTYVNQDSFSEEDRAHIREALQKAREENPALSFEFDFMERKLIQPDAGHQGGEKKEEKEERLCFLMRFQQYTGPLTAKALEDTVFYQYNRLLSLNEVGGSPEAFGISAEDFHAFNAKRFATFPHAFNATSTHDTKRGEDLRARINVLSELPGEWRANLRRWSKSNRKGKTRRKEAPDANDEYFLYQTLVGAFPFAEEDLEEFKERIRRYVVKAIREAKVHTAWIEPDQAYEEACVSFAERILDTSKENRFLVEFLPLQKKVAHYGILNSLSQALLKITCPGVPDFYQGTELWDLSLVDPDNRRPVDFEKRRSFLEALVKKGEEEILGLISGLMAAPEDGQIKLFLVHRALQARKEKWQLFQDGTYLPLEAGGIFRSNILAFARNQGDDWSVTIIPRLLAGIVGEEAWPLGKDLWQDTFISLPEGAPPLWRDAVSRQPVVADGRSLPVASALDHFPVALLMAEPESR